MKFQRMKDMITGAVVTALVLGSVSTVFAKVWQGRIMVNYNDIKIVVDGEKILTDKEPFIYEGTTYLPVRDVAKAVGKAVEWDGKTNTVYLGAKTKEATNEYVVKGTLSEISKWAVSDIYSKGIVNVKDYVRYGKGSDGKAIDIDQVLEDLGGAMDKAEGYNSFIKALDAGKYSSLQTTWDTFYQDLNKLYQKIEKEKPTAKNDSYDFNIEEIEKSKSSLEQMILIFNK